MPRTGISQFSFNRGELDPVLHGRSDWKYYFSGAEKLRNLIVRPQGGAVKRGGLRLVAEALEQDRPSIFIPFRFSVEQSYILEFGDYRMRIIKDGGLVVYPDTHAKAGETVVIATPFAAEDVPYLRYAQTADVMIFTHAKYAPRTLMRHDHHDWEFGALATSVVTASPTGLRITSSGGNNSQYVVTAWSSASGESLSSNIATATNPNARSYNTSGKTFLQIYDQLMSWNPSYIPAAVRFNYMTCNEMIDLLCNNGYSTAKLYMDGGNWKWQHYPPWGGKPEVWWTGNDTGPMIEECRKAADYGCFNSHLSAMASAMNSYISDYNKSLTVTNVNSLAWNPVSGASSYRVYRKTKLADKEVFYRIAEVSTTAYTDVGVAAQAKGLPEPIKLFSLPGSYPGVCTFFEQRLILGRSDEKPNTFWGSDTGQYNTFTRHTPVEEGDYYEFTLNSGEVNEIHWITPLNEMLLGTSGGEWKAGGGGYAITPMNINARVQSWYGCAPLNPVVVGRSVVFVGRSRQTIRNFSYSLEADGYAGRDLTCYAGHLFAERTVVSMCYQQEPSGIIWVVASDGRLFSCTYSPEEDVVAWSSHETRGWFESCGAIPDMDGSDQVYFCVRRGVGGVERRFVEVLDEPSDHVRRVEDSFFVDCGLTYFGSPTNRVFGLEHLEGEDVACFADGNVVPGLRVADGTLTLPDGIKAETIHVGLPFESELVTLELEPENGGSLRNRPRFLVSAAIRFHNTRECRYGPREGGLDEMRFRETPPGVAAGMFTGEKMVSLASSPGARSAALRLVSSNPVPFGVLGIVAEAMCGQPT